MTDLSADLGRIRIKNPIICASSEFTMTVGESVPRYKPELEP